MGIYYFHIKDINIFDKNLPRCRVLENSHYENLSLRFFCFRYSWFLFCSILRTRRSKYFFGWWSLVYTHRYHSVVYRKEKTKRFLQIKNMGLSFTKGLFLLQSSKKRSFWFFIVSYKIYYFFTCLWHKRRKSYSDTIEI